MVYMIQHYSYYKSCSLALTNTICMLYRYHSEGILGQIYDRVKEVAKRLDLTESGPASSYTGAPKINNAFLLAGYEIYVEDAYSLLDQYNYEIWQLMRKFDVYNECELISGCLVSLSRKLYHHEKNGDVQTRLNLAILQLRKNYIDIFYSDFTNVDTDTVLDYSHKNTEHRKVMQKASAWYYVTYTQKGQNYDPYLSFAWIAYKALCKVYEHNTLTNSVLK